MKKFDFTPFGLTSALSSLNTWIKFVKKNGAYSYLELSCRGRLCSTSLFSIFNFPELERLDDNNNHGLVPWFFFSAAMNTHCNIAYEL